MEQRVEPVKEWVEAQVESRPQVAQAARRTAVAAGLTAAVGTLGFMLLRARK
jgi:hypothetical protein